MNTAECQAEVPNGGVYTKNRYSACAVNLYALFLFNCVDSDCTQVGTDTWRLTTVGQGNNGDDVNKYGGAGVGSRMITYQTTMDEISIDPPDGPGNAVSLEVDMQCLAINPAYACDPGAGNGRDDLITDWDLPDNGTAAFSFTSPMTQGDTGDRVVTASAYVSVIARWAEDATVLGPSQASVPFRFDSAGRNQDPQRASKWTGRQDAVTFNIVPVIWFNGQCPDVTCTAIQQSVAHMQLAFTNSAGTLPPWTQGGAKPQIPGSMTNPFDYLSRTTDPVRKKANGDIKDEICPTIYNTALPAGQNCDELPFGSTYQGTASGGPYSLMRILGTDNKESGRRLGGFYRAQRLLDSDPVTCVDTCDAFGVLATGTAAPPRYGYTVINEVPGGQFATEWTDMGLAESVLGGPTDAEFTVAAGQEQDFDGGGIYWSANTGTHEVHGPVNDAYTALGGPAHSPEGFPLGDQQPTPDGGGVENLFAGTTCGTASGSAIIWSPATPASEMHGCIYQAYLSTFGGTGGALGYPDSNEEPMGTGRVSYLAGTSCGTQTGSAIYWNGTAHSVTGCVFQQYKSAGEATGSLGFPTGEAYPVPGGVAQDFQHGTISSVNGVTTTQLWHVGHAAHAGDDYPYETMGQFNHIAEGTDAWNEYYGQCDSFAAWKVYENLAGSAAQHPAGSVPAVGWTPGNASISPVNQFTWGPNGGPYGNADVWATQWAARGYTVDNSPSPGAIAWWPNAVTDPQDGNPPDPAHGLSSVGHVAYVTDVYPDGSITIEQYNLEGTGEYSIAHLAYNTGYTDTSFGRTEQVPWPGGFIHVADGPSGGASPAEPPVGTVRATYPSQPSSGLTVLGPGDPAGDLSLAGAASPGTVHGWSTASGHGEDGQMLYTNTHHGAADSTATWNASLAANSCYRIDAFVPDTWSNNAGALYTVTDQHFGSSMVPVDENLATNQWVELGVFQARPDGTLPVELVDQGAGGGQVAADAMRYVRQADCSMPVRAAQTLTPTLAGAAYPGTVDGWYLDSGLGQLGASRYTYTSGPTVGSSATWSASVLPNACYEVLAYVPSNHSDSYQAMYTVTAAAGTPTVSVDENAYTDGFATIGDYRATATGALSVKLTDQSLASSDAVIAADTMSFAQITCAGALEGPTYPALTAGPGSPLSSFSLSHDWYPQYGRGYLGYAKWTHTNGSTPESTATWSFSGLPANTCYQVSAYIPDNNANDPLAHYQGYMGSATAGTFMFSMTVDQSGISGWTPLGVLGTGAGSTVSVVLDDTGPGGKYVGVDAVQLVHITGNCGVPAGLNPGAYPWPGVGPTTYIDDGHGYYEGECVSFAAWAIRSDGLPHTKSPDHLGNANQWTGAYVDSGPHVGDIAQWDPNVNGAGSLGHVAYVAAVYSNGTIEVYEYNWLDSYDNNTGHRLSIRTIPASAPSRYLHF